MQLNIFWTIDTTAPTVSITNQPASLTNATNSKFEFFPGTDTGGASICWLSSAHSMAHHSQPVVVQILTIG